MRDRAGAIVVGGGIQGAAMALHLLEAGVEDVRLLERDAMFEATSAAGAGFVALWAAITARPYGEQELAVERYGIAFYRALQDRGHALDFVQNGLLLVAASDEAMRQLESIRREDLDPDTVVVDGDRIKALTYGAVCGDQSHGGVFQPGGAQLFTPQVGPALVTRILQEGGRIDSRRPVLEVRVDGGRVTGVRTADGVLESDTVIVAAGAWSKELLRPLGVHLPCIPQVTSRVITEPLGIPAAMPALMLWGVTPDGSRLWIRQHEAGLLWGGVYTSHPRDALVGLERLPERFDDVPIDGVLASERVARAAAPLMPALGRYKSMRIAHGAPCYTPDHRGLVGPVPSIEGLYALAGDNEAGITHGPGFAKVLADHIVRGSSDLADLDAWRLDRFDGRYTTDAEVAAGIAM